MQDFFIFVHFKLFITARHAITPSLILIKPYEMYVLYTIQKPHSVSIIHYNVNTPNLIIQNLTSVKGIKLPF